MVLQRWYVKTRLFDLFFLKKPFRLGKNHKMSSLLLPCTQKTPVNT